MGDLNVDSVIELAATYLGSLPKREKMSSSDESRQPKFPTVNPSLFPCPPRYKKGWWTLPIRQMITGIFIETGGSPCFQRCSQIGCGFSIRDEMGAAYALDAYNDPSRAYPGYGVLHSVVLIAPGSNRPGDCRCQRYCRLILSKTASAPRNFNGPLKPVLEKIKEMVKTNTYWLNNVLTDSSRHPEQLDWSRTFQSDYAAITAEELFRLAKQYLKNQAAATIVIVPEKSAGR